jgi:hypothetical protein
MFAVFRVLCDWIPCSRRRLPSVLATWCRPGLKPGNSHLVPGTLRPVAGEGHKITMRNLRPSHFSQPSRCIKCNIIASTFFDYD